MPDSYSVACPGPASFADRRRFLAGGLGGLLSLAIPRWQAAAANVASKRSKACILLWMNGGPSHLDTFDPKPGTKAGGSFKAIKTSVPGVQICEHMPLLAEQAQQLAIIRSMTSKEGNHDRGQYLMHTGYSPSVTLKHPSLGAWVSHELGDPTFELPNFVSIRGPSIGAGFLGAEHSPFAVLYPNQGVRNLPLAKDVDARRFDSRLEALKILQNQFRAETGAPGVDTHDTVYAKAVRMMRSPLAKTFDVDKEPASVRQAYGESDFGRGCLMARRLVEAGVKFVEVTLDGWDTHVDNFTGVKNLLGHVDPAMSTLLKDLDQRKLLDDTLVIWMGEFGRTPRISPADGRDHYPNAWSAVLAGGGARGGQAYGATNEDGSSVVKDPITVPNYFATLAKLLGIDPARELMSPVGRPIAISENGKPIDALIAAGE
jgi:uncharacterized protein (DUF1501 family)